MGAAIRAAGLVFRRPLQAPRAVTTRTAHCANAWLLACLFTPLGTDFHSRRNPFFFLFFPGDMGRTKKNRIRPVFFLNMPFFLDMHVCGDYLDRNVHKSLFAEELPW